MRKSYMTPATHVAGPDLVFVSVKERFRLDRISFIWGVRDMPGIASIHAVRERLPLLRRSLNALIDWWLKREFRRVLGGVQVRALQVGVEEQLAEGVSVPALSIDDEVLQNLRVAEGGDRISLALDGTCPEQLSVLFWGDVGEPVTPEVA